MSVLMLRLPFKSLWHVSPVVCFREISHTDASPKKNKIIFRQEPGRERRRQENKENEEEKDKEDKKEEGEEGGEESTAVESYDDLIDYLLAKPCLEGHTIQKHFLPFLGKNQVLYTHKTKEYYG